MSINQRNLNPHWSAFTTGQNQSHIYKKEKKEKDILGYDQLTAENEMEN